MQEAGNGTGRAQQLSITTAMLLAFMPIIAAGAFFYGRTHAREATDVPATRMSQAAGVRTMNAGAVASSTNAASSPTSVPTATQVPLIDVLRAADILVQAGVIEPPTPEPPLIEILQAADILARAGKLGATASPLTDVLNTPANFVDALRLRALAAALAPEPPLIDVLNAATILVDAGVIPPPPYVTPAAARTAAAALIPPPVPAAPPPLAPPPPPPAPVAADGWHDAQFTQQVFDGVNRRRAQSGLGPLAPESRLTTAAASYAQMLGANRWFSHTGPDGSSMVDRITAAGFPFTVQVGEVLAMGSAGWPPEGVVQAWIDSAPHREQILDGAYTRAGADCYFSYEPHLMVRCVMNLAG